MTISIENAAPEQHDSWLELWHQYLSFYAVELSADVTASTWARLLNPSSRLSGRFAFLDGEMVGFALHHHHLSTWVAGEDCYLEDLFVKASARGDGVGRALLDDLRVIATAKGCKRLYWHTDEGNETARRLYDHYAKADGHVRYRLHL